MLERMKRKKGTWRLPQAKDVHIDIDKYINPFVPPSQLYRLPKPIARFLGYRETPPPELGHVLLAFWSLLGAFCGLFLVGAVFHYSDQILQYHPPVVFGSLGATAILEYNAIQSPLAQPRAAIVGHAIAAVSGVAITKLFMLRSDFDDLRWVAGAVTCSVASALMTLTNTVHPPGGATALLAAVDPTVSALGWIFVPLALLGSTIMIGVALLVNNIQRQFPTYWWTPKDVGRQKKEDLESATEEKKDLAVLEGRVEKERRHFQPTITLSPDDITLPEDLALGQMETEVLEVIRDRLRDMARRGHGLSTVSSVGSEGTSETK